jgi:UDP-N-acetylglucosamine:LPS N-acetylglucosamine transferase
VQLLLVCSTGGHLLQLLALRAAWEEFPRAWVTFDRTDARSLLRNETTFFAYGPTNRSLKNLVRNAFVAVRLMRRLRPKVILTTGAGVAVPFAWVGRAFDARVVYVESLTRIDRPSLSLRLLLPAADRVYVQWPQLVPEVPGAHYAGQVFSAG